MLFRTVSNENATIDFVLIWAASAQTATQHAASVVQCHRHLNRESPGAQYLSMKTNGPSNASVDTDRCFSLHCLRREGLLEQGCEVVPMYRDLRVASRAHEI